jgi:hypothetical protein
MPRGSLHRFDWVSEILTVDRYFPNPKQAFHPLPHECTGFGLLPKSISHAGRHDPTLDRNTPEIGDSHFGIFD